MKIVPFLFAYVLEIHYICSINNNKPNIMRARETKVWQFFTTDTEGRNCLVNEIECKAPERTNQWKELQWSLIKAHIVEVGYQLKTN